VRVGFSGLSSADKLYFKTVALLLGATVSSTSFEVLVAKRTDTRRAVAAAALPSVTIVRTDWLLTCWAHASRCDSARFEHGTDDDDDDDDTLLTQRPFAVAAAPRALKQQLPPQPARSVNSVFSLTTLKKTATSWWSRFVGDVQPQPQPVQQAAPVHEIGSDATTKKCAKSSPQVEFADEEPVVIRYSNNTAKSQNDDPQAPTPDEEPVDAADEDVWLPESPASGESGGGAGAATQQAMALSQRYLPCMAVQFDDFASQRDFFHIASFGSGSDQPEPATQQIDEPVDVKYGHKRKLVAAPPLSPVLASQAVLSETVVDTEASVAPPPLAPVEVAVAAEEPPAKKARTRKGKKTRAPPKAPTPPPVVVIPDDEDDDSAVWASDVYAGASHPDPRCLLIAEGLQDAEREEAERKQQKQRRAIKQLKQLGVDAPSIPKRAAILPPPPPPPLAPIASMQRRRTRKRKATHTRA
jgi:hypothetical protein